MNRIRELRKSLNLSQAEFAKSLSVHQTAVSQWENGRTSPDIEIAKRISDKYNVSLDYLLGNDISTNVQPVLDSDGLNARDRKDIAKDMESIREKLTNKTGGPASFNGKNIDDDDAELLLDAIEMMLKRVKKINKVKYNPNKNKD